MISEDYYHIDLHVHTPSSNDYKGGKDDDEYIRILKVARENKIDLIAVTDHISVQGYNRIIEFKKKTRELVHFSRLRNFKIDRTVEQEHELFNSVYVLMGIELKVSPGIHYIVVFNESIKPENVENFLCRLVGQDICTKYSSPDYMLEINSKTMFQTFKDEFGSNCFIYAPHADSTGGVISALKDLGTERLTILKNENLLCIDFNQDSNRDYIKKNLLPQVFIERKKMLNFIQNSDYHGGVGEKVGSLNFSVERSEGKLCYDILLKRLNKHKDIKTTIDTSQERYKEFVKDIEKEGSRIISFGLLSDIKDMSEIEEQLCKTTCAILNSNKCYIEFELNISLNEDLKQQTNKIFDSIVQILTNKIENFLSKSIRYLSFQISKSKHKVIIWFEESERLSLYNGLCYFFNSHNDISIAKAHQIESIVAKKIQEKLGISKEKLIDKITTTSSRIRNCLSNYSLFYKIDKKIISSPELLIEFIIPTDLPSNIKKETLKQGLQNGVADSDFVYIGEFNIKGGRRENSYFRFSSPTFRINESDIPVDVIPKAVTEKSILIVEGGGSMLVDTGKKIFGDEAFFLISLKDLKIEPEILMAYLKSSLVQWLLYKIYDYDDLFQYFLLTGEKRIPIVAEFEKVNSATLISFVNNVLIEEGKILHILEKTKEEDKISKEVDNHNNKCDNYCRGIDKHLFDFLEFDKTDVELIFDELSNIKIYDFKFIENIDRLYQ